MRRIAAGVAVSLMAVAGWRFAKACAPDFHRAVFSYARHPDLPRAEFIDGRLGVLQPTFARSYLVIAYRYLNGIGMNSREREQARDYYKDRATGGWDRTGTDWAARWYAVRSRIPRPVAPAAPLVTGGQLAYDPETHSFALNCAEDAFRVALHTLEARRGSYGASSAAFRAWLGAQDTVFQACRGSGAPIPEAASADLPAAIRADREYQIAAAHFYAGDYRDALERFRRISQDAASPWHAISRYLVVRTLLRMTEDAKSAEQAGAQLDAEARAVLADSKLSAVHGMTWNLVQRAGIRQRDPEYFRALAHLLSSKGQDNGLREELWNYTDLYDAVIVEADSNASFRRATQAGADVSRFPDADLSDWIFHLQSRDAAVFGHCLRRWQQTRSVAWLLAALGHTDADGARRAGLLAPAGAVPEGSPGYLTARFHLLRMYAELGDKTAARDGLDAVLAGAPLKGLPSSTNLFRGLRMLAAPTFDDFVRFAVRKPVLVTLQINYGEAPDFQDSWPKPTTGERFDTDATGVLNRRTPFRLLKEAAVGGALPAELKREALTTAFTRGLMLDEDVPEIARQMKDAIPDAASYADEYLGAKDSDSRRFAAAYLLLHRPEARPYFGSGISRQSKPGKMDLYRDNWWCPMDIETELDSRASNRWYLETPNLLQESAAGATPEFLSGAAGDEAKREMERLEKLSAATDFLGGIVLRYAESHAEDARIPEALYWIVRAGHYGCPDTDTWRVTRAAFRMLQLRYAGSSWAERTPVWSDIRREVKARKE